VIKPADVRLDGKETSIVASQENQRSYFCLAAWVTGVVFILLKGIHRDPWAVGVFVLDLLTLLTGYLFLSFGHVQAGAFALGQGLLLDIFSSGPNGLCALIYVSVFLGIYLGSLFFNLQTVKGQIIIVSLAVLLKNVMWQAVIALLSGSMVFSTSFFCGASVSIVGTGLLAPVLYGAFDRLRGVPRGEEDAPVLEDLKDRTWENDHY
jgi:hypothetical protein